MRPLTKAEWAMLMREHDVVDEVRKLVKGCGEINTLRDLERALKRYDEALEHVACERSPWPTTRRYCGL